MGVWVGECRVGLGKGVLINEVKKKNNKEIKPITHQGERVPDPIYLANSLLSHSACPTFLIKTTFLLKIKN